MKPTFLCLLLGLLLALAPSGLAVVDDAHSFAMEAAIPYVKKGYAIREEHWAGWTTNGKQNSIQHQLFKGNDYWFFLASDEEAARVSIHIYDDKGNLVDAEVMKSRQKYMAGVRVQPKKTGTYYVVFQVDESKLKRTRWAVAYGYK